MMRENEERVDLILPWVDGSDPEWRALRREYDPKGATSDSRYESWDNLQYVFRGIERNMPWVGRIFFVTCGQLPEWLNTENERLKIIKHTDYIPEQYLPTFNSNTIEMNYFRIPELSENFILFNDDILPTRFLPRDYFFRGGIPCEQAIESHFTLKGSCDCMDFGSHTSMNNMLVINKYFDKRKVQKRDPFKWYNPCYGRRQWRTWSLRKWNNFEQFMNPHEGSAMKKSTLQRLWELEPELLDRASRNRFRSYTDVSQRLVTYWQICSGDFVPRAAKGKFFRVNAGNCGKVAAAIREKKYPLICFNEDSPENFQQIRQTITAAMEEILPEKSSFER